MRKLILVLVLVLSFMLFKSIEVDAWDEKLSCEVLYGNVTDVVEVELSYICNISLSNVSKGEEISVDISDKVDLNSTQITQTIESDNFTGSETVEIESEIIESSEVIKPFKAISDEDIDLNIILDVDSYIEEGIDIEVSRNGVSEVLNYNLDDTELNMSDIDNNLLVETDGIKYDDELELYYQDLAVSAPIEYYNYNIVIDYLPIITFNDGEAYNYNFYAQYNTINNKTFDFEEVKYERYRLKNDGTLNFHFVLGAKISKVTYEFKDDSENMFILDSYNEDSFPPSIYEEYNNRHINVNNIIKRTDILIYCIIAFVLIYICTEIFKRYKLGKIIGNELSTLLLFFDFSIICFFCINFPSPTFSILVFVVLLISYLIYSDFKVMKQSITLFDQNIAGFLVVLLSVGSFVFFLLVKQLPVTATCILILLHICLLYNYRKHSSNLEYIRKLFNFELFMDIFILICFIIISKLTFSTLVTPFLFICIVCLYYGLRQMFLRNYEDLNNKNIKYFLLKLIVISGLLVISLYLYSTYDETGEYSKLFNEWGEIDE